MSDYKTIAESRNFIVLDKYTENGRSRRATRAKAIWSASSFRIWSIRATSLPDMNTPADLLANVRVQLQALNNVQFTDGEWLRFVETWLDKPSDGIVEKTRKIHDDYIHDFV
jgi:type I restriction enzyme R subunit